MLQEKITSSASRARPQTRVLLFVEDDPAVAYLFRWVSNRLQRPTAVYVVGTGNAALAFLRREPPFENAPRPDLLILDINLPGEDGFHTLERIRADDQLGTLPAVFFSTSLLRADHARAAKLGALDFMHKPQNLSDFEVAVRTIHAYCDN